MGVELYHQAQYNQCVTLIDLRALSMKLFEIGRLSCGQAAELAGYSKRTYMELLGRHGVAVMDYPASELQDDLGNA